MLRLLTLFSLLTVTMPASAQVSYSWYLDAQPFTSQPSGGPLLEPIGTILPQTLQVPASTCPNEPIITTSYFGYNSGLKAKSFFTDNYSVEIIFRFKELMGYNRIIDFSNSNSDFGIYTLGDCLNFYPNGSIGVCPGAFDTTNFYQLVITRNGTTKQMNVYVNATLFTTFDDLSDHYVVGNAPNDSIKFFKDDNVVGNEESDGNVAFIRLSNFELSSAQVQLSFDLFCNTITTVGSVNSNTISVWPNPVADQLHVEGVTRKGVLTLYNSLGRRVSNHEVQSGSSVDLGNFSPGIYYYMVETQGEITSGSLVKF